MATTVGEINVEIRAKMDALANDISKGKSLIERGAQDMRVAATAVTAYFAALGGNELLGFVQSVIDSAGALQDMSEQAGITVEALSGIQQVARLSGTDMNTVVTATQKLSRAMVDALDPTSAAAQTFKALGVNVKDANGNLKTADQVLMEVSVAQGEFKEGVRKSDAMMNIFGKTGANLLPLFNDLAEAGQLNGRVTSQQAQAADAFAKEMVKLKIQMEEFLRGAILPLLPYLTNIGPLLRAAAIATGAYFAVFVGMPALVTASTAALAAFQGMQVQMALASMSGVTALGAMKLALYDTAAATMAAVTSFGLLKTAFLAVAAAFVGWEIGTWLRENFVEAQLAGIAFVEGMLVGWETLKYGAEVAWLGIKTAFGAVMEGIGEVFATQLDIIAGALAAIGADSAADGVRGYATSLREATVSSVDFGKEQVELKTKYDTNVAAVREITGEMADEAIQHFATKDATKSNGAAKGELVVKTKEATEASKKLAEQVGKTIEALEFELQKTQMTGQEIAIATAIRQAGKGATEKQKDEIARLVVQIDIEKQKTIDSKAEIEFMTKARDDHNKKIEAETKALQDKLAQMREELTNYGKTKLEIEANKLKRMDEALAIADAEEALKNVCDQRTADVQAMHEQRDAQAGIVAVMGELDIVIAQKKQADDAQKAWEDSAKAIENALTDSLMRGFESGKSMVDSIRDYFVNAFKTTVVQMIVQPVMGAVNGLFAPGSAGGGAAGSVAGSAASNLFGSAANYLGLGSTSGLAGAFNAGAGMTGWTGAGSMASFQGAGSMMANGSFMQGGAQMLGTAAPWIGGAAAGIGIGSAIAGDMSFAGMNGTTSSAIGTAIGAAIAGPIGAVIGGALGGLVNAAFGHGDREILHTDLQGTVGGGEVTGAVTNSRWKEAGGWFTSDDYGNIITAVDEKTRELLNTGANAILDKVTFLAEGLNLPTEMIAGITTQMNVRLTGKAAEDGAAITAALEQYQTAITAGYAAAIAPFQRAGESIIDTMQRLAVLEIAAGALNQFGGIFSSIAAQGTVATESMISLAGGLDKLIEKSQAFVNSYYGEDEQAGIAARGVMAALQAAGISAEAIAGLSSKGDFRALVESIDISTETGRAQLNSLLDIAPSFASLSTALDAQGGSLVELTELAPQIAALEPLFGESADTTAAATADAAETTSAAINGTTNAVTASGANIVSAINGLAVGLNVAISSAVSAATSASNSALATLSGSLDTIATNTRLADAAAEP